MKRLLLILWVGVCFVASAAAQTPPAGADEGPRQLWQLLDYVAVDYGGRSIRGPSSVNRNTRRCGISPPMR